MSVQFLSRCHLSTIIIFMVFLKTGKSDKCDTKGANGVAEKKICDAPNRFQKFRAIKVYSHGISDGVNSCICKVDFYPDIKYVSVGYYTNSGGRNDCGLKVDLGNNRSFSCKSQHHANVTRFNDIKFSRASDSSPHLCLEIRSATPMTIQCQPSAINYIDTESKDSQDEDIEISAIKSTRQTLTSSSSFKHLNYTAQSTTPSTSATRQPLTIKTTTTSSEEDSDTTFSSSTTGSSQSTTPSTSATRQSSTIKTTTTSSEEDSDTTFSSSTTGTSSISLTEVTSETSSSSSFNETTDPFVVPVGEYKETTMFVGIFVSLAVILIMITAFYLRYKYKKQRKGSRLITQDTAKTNRLDTSTDEKKTEHEEATVTYNVAYNMDIPISTDHKKTEFNEATVTYNVAYNMEIPPKYPANNTSIHNTGEKCGDLYDKAREDDLVITDNVMYNVGLDNEVTNDNSNMFNNDRGDSANEIEESQAPIYHEIP